VINGPGGASPPSAGASSHRPGYGREVTSDQLRIGTLSTARITPPALLTPARQLTETVVTAVAARDRAQAQRFAAAYGIPVVHDSYEALIADPDIDAVYNPLPNSLHARWTLRAIEAGKHVLCEKPFTSDAAQAREVAAAARASGLVVMEAMHYRYHPLAQTMLDQLSLIAGPRKAVRHVRVIVSFPLDGLADIRYDYDLAGGATMDAGCYAIDCIRLLGPGEPQVEAALATELEPRVDRAMSAMLRFGDGGTAWFDISFTQGGKFRADVHVVGEHGQLRVQNFIHPHIRYRMTTMTAQGIQTVSSPPGESADTTYAYQLRAFAAAVLRGEPFPTTPEHAIVTMSLIDDVYRAAGLPPRGET
jgi:predicted dehydrogenase